MFRSAKYLVVAVLVAASSIALAQSSGGAFEITHSTIDNGGQVVPPDELIFADGFESP